MSLFKNEVGRPSNEIISKRKKIKVIVTSIVLVLVAVIGLYTYNTFFSINPIEGEELNVTPATNKFTVQNLGNNCYTIYAPTNAKNWRIQVYYKKTGAWSYGSNKMLQYNHYNDGKKDQKICLTKQKNTNETYRILVKWTTGANDKAYTKVKVKNWKPAGWSHNSTTGWSYTDVKVDWSKVTSNNNTNNNNSSNNTTTPVGNDITLSFSGTNGSVIVNGKQYSKGTSVSSSTIGSNYLFGNSNGKTQVSVKLIFPKAIYTYTKPNAASYEETKHLFRVVTYDKNGKEVYNSGLTRITAASHSKTVTLSNAVTSIKAFVYTPGTRALTAGLQLKVFTIKATAIPTITTKTTGERIKNDNGYLWDSFTTYGEKKVTFTVNNPNNIQLYGRWMTYPTYEAKNPGWKDESCTSITKTYTRTSSLTIDSKYPQRKGIYKVFGDKASCEKNSGHITSSTVWYEYARTSTTSDGFRQLRFNNASLSKKVGTQIKGKCYSTALAYGVFILSNGSKVASKTSTDPATYGAIDGKTSSVYGVWNLIKTKIDAGIPVVIQVANRWSYTHWVTVYAYNTNYKGTSNMSEKNLLQNIKVIDPYHSSGYNKYNLTLYNGIASKRNTANDLHRSRATRTWASTTSYK